MKVKVIYPPDVIGETSRFGTTRTYDFEAMNGSPSEVVEHVYREFNRVDGNEHISRANLEERSLSVGDMVQLDGGETYVIDKFGSRVISPEGRQCLETSSDFRARQWDALPN